MDWPAYSPDLNPIEHVWDMLGRRIAARQPPPACLPELRRALLDEWCNVPQDQIDNLILSMTRRCGLFESGDEMLETAFKYAVERVNTDPRLLPNSRLTPQLERVERHDSFQAARKVCDLLSEGMAAMFGPQSNEGSAAVQSTCDVLEVPHIETRWDYRTKRDNHSINLFPHPSALGRAYLEFVKAKDWKKFAIVYEESDVLGYTVTVTGFEGYGATKAIIPRPRHRQRSSHNNTVLPLLPVDMQFEIPCFRRICTEIIFDPIKIMLIMVLLSQRSPERSVSSLKARLWPRAQLALVLRRSCLEKLRN
ncbi:glutamate receptor ionotropic, kainate 1 [Trichonephila clavipes]|nr:glutamate receptor ionotropic, kainate 1 [Trichonephila clavipes]